jgi:hypothetical protein
MYPRVANNINEIYTHFFASACLIFIRPLSGCYVNTTVGHNPGFTGLHIEKCANYMYNLYRNYKIGSVKSIVKFKYKYNVN